MTGYNRFTALCFFIGLGILAALAACSAPGDDEWANINYADIECGAGAAKSPSLNCKSDDDEISSIGRSGRGRGR